MNKLLTHIPGFLKNKYFISFAAFCVVMLFLDKNDFLTQLNRRNELGKLQQSKSYYTKEINQLRTTSNNLTNNPQTIEKTAREKYLMKRDNEELFVISENSDNTKN
ncbi:MAG: septum formation initiator family protein [Chitinophagaceae bacterium]|jgi:cell division protein FtsB|nr:septum formation initiator family protein [Chitinophagaceae bacterium]MBK7680159.1 septum formation initiator family protein [Chitinophagaceae bacterium]MBK8301120.1 septum formation initiator family protein [Chitinophagaceae bacterium]MBK9465456.1 septum formation initiator family protein [Chitinophagaceae bacterium]MBK9660796.1 septum formation initiator family protein [Chitinophagaceae bacterium]